MLQRTLRAAAAAFLIWPLSAASIDAARLARIPRAMQSFVDKGAASGYVTLVAFDGKVVALHAVGYRDREAKAAMTPDTIFQIASMTKPVTATAILILMEEGRLALTDPVEKHLPEFRRGSGPSGMTLRDLLTHTSGMPGGPPAALTPLFDSKMLTLAESVAIHSQQPKQFETGTRWQYSNPGIATLGRIVEVVSGVPFEQFLQQRIFDPLGMPDTFFYAPDAKKPRIAVMYNNTKGTLQRDAMDIFKTGGRYPAPEGGLYSTAPDYHHFLQMLANGGVFEGRRILSRAAVELMTVSHTGNLTAGFAPGIGYGLAVSVVRNADGMFRLNSAGSYGHGGAWRTYGWVDPAKKLVGVLMMQRISTDGDMADEISAFMAMASSAVE